ncbi:hypothetical protein CRYUN_Cryun25bG0088500 [Craigia yunnanensis]
MLDMFTLDNKKTNVSVAHYFHDKYNIVLKYASLPALQCGTGAKPIYLPMELCRIVRGQRYTKKLNDQQVKAMLNATCQRPPEREKNILKIVGVNNFEGDELVDKEFGFQVKKELALVEGRVFPPPMLKYHDSGRERSVYPGFGAWNMINKKMINGGKVDFWTCVNFSLEYANMSEDLCKKLVKMCNNKGMVFCQTASIRIRSARSDRIDQALLDVFKASTSLKRPLQLLIIILPDQTGSYGKIKRICETELGIVSQCCQPKQAARFSNQYFVNLALKINVKVGGRNTVLDDAIQRKIPPVFDFPTIIFGADVIHPQPGKDSSSSIAAVVASMDWPEVTKYRGIVSAQPHREEIIQDLYKTVQDPQKGVVHSGMIRYVGNCLWLSLSQLDRNLTGLFSIEMVLVKANLVKFCSEVDAIRKACASLQEGYMPRVTFIVVQNRHHTRLFPTDRNQTDRSGNVQAGTVVDTSICHPTDFDFYLNSHAGIQISCKYSQTIYITLPPAYYARLDAFRARYYVEDKTSDCGRKANDRNFEVRPLPRIKDNVKEVMFFC